MQLSDAQRLIDYVEFAFERHMAVQGKHSEFIVTSGFLNVLREHLDAVRYCVKEASIK